MKSVDYTFSFEPIQNQYNHVMMIDHLEDKSYQFDVCINDSDLLFDGLTTVPTISADLLDLAMAIHAVDRLIKRREDLPFSFHIDLPVRNLDVFLKSDIHEDLVRVLEWYTNDRWSFGFSKRDVLGRFVEIQPQFPLGNISSNLIETALWSGGLDSLAGLYTQLSNERNTHFILVGTGCNTYVHKTQKRIADELEKLFPERIYFKQIPYRWSGTPMKQKSFDQRARGLVFLLVGAACAYRYGQSSLFIYENGLGAINLPYSKAEVGLDHARSVHPLSLLYMGEFVFSILEIPFKFVNPYLFWTKAQMCKSLKKTHVMDLIPLTSSCDRPRRLPKGITQCGACTSCLLRRQSLSSLKIIDPTPYQNGGYLSEKNNLNLRVMAYQISKIRKLLDQDKPWQAFSKEFVELDDVVDQVSRFEGLDPNLLRKQILQMYRSYVNEWRIFEEYLAQEKK